MSIKIILVLEVAMAIEVTENQKMMNMIARMSVMPFLVIMVFSSCNNKLLEKDYEVIVENKYEFPIDFYILTEKPFSNQNEYDTSKILMYKSKASINFGNYVQNAQFYIGEVGTNGLLSTAGFANAHRVKITFEIGRKG